eukprot:SM009097S24465  [mRNA]  locus=s9097:53:427:+ [translate_table: standard]
MADPGDAGDYAGDTTLALYCELLRTDKSADVRRAIVASLPPCPAAAAAVLERVTDINEGVRRAAFSWLAHKLPMTALRQAAPI